MNTQCLCAEARAAQSAATIDRLNERVNSMRQQWRDQCDISDSWRVQKDELRRLLEQERAEKALLITALDESRAREEAMRDVTKDLNLELVDARDAVEIMAANVRDRDRQIAELRKRIVENAEQARAIRIGVSA